MAFIRMNNGLSVSMQLEDLVSVERDALPRLTSDRNMPVFLRIQSKISCCCFKPVVARFENVLAICWRSLIKST